jgi:hypothetical protein
MIQKIVKAIVKKNKKWTLFAVLGIICCVAFIYKVALPKKHDKRLKTPYFITAPIIGASYGMPCIELAIESKYARVGIDLGFLGHVFLPREFICELNEKKYIEDQTFYGYRGKQYQTELYQIPKLNIAGMNFNSPDVLGMNQEFESDAYIIDTISKPSDFLGSLGWKIFYNSNLLLDCPNSQIAFCDSLETLKHQGYPIEDFTQIPLLLDRDYVEFEANTNKGTLRCTLDTGATWNILNEEPSQIENPERYETEFALGGADFKVISFRKIKTPFKIDAVIGMEFIHDKVIFIDFRKEKLYFYAYPK